MSPHPSKTVSLSAVAFLSLSACERFPPDGGPAAYIIVPATSVEQGNAVIEAMGTELPADQRRLVQVRSFIDGRQSVVMVRFAGSCADGRFVAEAKRVANAHGVATVACVATLPTPP